MFVAPHKGVVPEILLGGLTLLMRRLKCICNEIFECVFSPKIANSIFLMHNDHIVFAIDAEEG